MVKILLKFLPLIIHEGFDLLGDILEKRRQRKIDLQNKELEKINNG